ncbi:MAG: right-handed parallel beta-helix repeat-containing protein, partial [Candidatus Marinimicrobia bacterium]|nr:right-handed parallel beta-helix repeat-containing protein [Candidatus Neomarinimicrobiota bacterium]
DGNGKLLLGAGSAVDKQGLYARAASGAVLNVNVSNLTVEGFRHGAYYRMATGTIDNCTFIDCQKGANINSRRSPLVTGVVFSNNTLSWPANSDFTKMAIEFRGGPDGKILNNTIIVEDTIGTGIGVERGWPIAEGGYNTVNGLYEGNTITITGDGKVTTGFLLDRSIDNTFVNNTIIGNFDYGIDVKGSPTVFSTGNVFTNTEITGASGIGVRFLFSSDNEFDSLIVTNTDFSIVSESGSKGNVFWDSELADSILVEDNSNLFLFNTTFDQNKVSVEEGSAVFIGEMYCVEVTALLLNVVPTEDMDVVVENALGDELNSYVTDEEGKVYFELAPVGLSASGYSADMNPFKITASMLIEGALYEDVVMATITSDTSFTLGLIHVGVDQPLCELPAEFSLSQNYPNPFNPITTISYALPVDSKVTLRIYDAMGGLVRTLVDEKQNAGYKSVLWNGRNESGSKVSSGIYFYRIAAGDFTQVKKMVFLK